MENLQELFDSDLMSLIASMEKNRGSEYLLWDTAQACAIFRYAYRLNMISMDDWIRLDDMILSYENRLFKKFERNEEYDAVRI